MSDTLQQIKDRLDVADFIRTYVQLSPAGKNLKGLCPFHKEKTPSFVVSPDRQIWHCFGCSAGGDVIAFLMRYENLEFFEALKILGEKAGIDVGRSGNQDQRQLNVLYDANRSAKDFFKKNLAGSSLDYLKSRGLKPETIAEFELGFAPDQTDALARHLLNSGYSAPVLEKAGLILKTDRGTYRDRFRNRIMFPIANQFGKIVGFTGRIMPGFESDNIGKYVNSPETQIFNKSKILYGLDKSKNFIRENRTAVLMEGQMDFLMSWQDGVKNLVATSGTAITADHLKHLKRLTDTLILSFDQDEAGRAATERTIDLAYANDFTVKVLNLPPEIQAKDPADVAKAQPGFLKTVIEKAEPAMQFYFRRYNISDKSDVSSWKKNIRAILSKLKPLYSSVERSHWLQELSSASGIDERNLIEEMDNLKTSATPLIEAEVPTEPLRNFIRRDMISQRAISLVLNYKNLSEKFYQNAGLLAEPYRRIADYFLKNGVLSLTEDLRPIADLISLRSGLEISYDGKKAENELSELFRQLRLDVISENLKEKHRLIEQYEKADKDILNLLSEKDRLVKEKHQLEIEGHKEV